MPANPRSIRIALIATILSSPVLYAQEETSTTTTAPPTPSKVEVSTEVQGKVPKDVVGRWLAVSQVKLASGQIRPLTRAFEIRQNGDRFEMELATDVPSPVAAKVATASGAGQAWTPTEEDLRSIDQGWRVLTPDPHSYSKVEYKILGSDAYPPEFQSDETTKDSKFVITIRESYAGAQAVRTTYAVYAVREQTPTELKGTSLTTTVAVAFVPIPIALKGDFQAYRIGPPPSGGSLLERLSGFFSGCGR